MHQILEELLTWLRHVWRGRWLALAIAWLVCLVGWTVVTILPDEYESSARIYADTDRMLSPVFAGIGVARDRSSQLTVIEQTLLSGPNIDAVLRSGSLLPEGVTPDSVSARALASRIRAETEILVEERNFFGITYSDTDPALAQRVVQALLEAMTSSGIGTNREQLTAAAELINQQITAAKVELDAAEAELTRFQERNSDLVGSGDRFFRRLQAARTAVTDLRGEAALVRAERDELERQLAATPRTLVPTTPAGLPALSGRRGELAALRERLVELKSRYTPQHPDIVSTERTIARLENDLVVNPESAAPGPSNPTYERLRLQLAQARANAARVGSELEQAEARVEELSGKAQVVPEAEAEFRALNRDYDLLKENYEQLTKQRDSARIAGALESHTSQVDFRVIEPPSLPDRPSNPNRLLLLTAVLLIGLALGGGLAWLTGMVKEPFDSPKSLQAAFDLRVLGSVSQLRRREDRDGIFARTMAFAAGCCLLVVVLVGLVVAEEMRLVAPLRTPAPAVSAATQIPAEKEVSAPKFVEEVTKA